MGLPLQSRLMPLLDEPPKCVLLGVELDVLVLVGVGLFNVGSSACSDSNGLLMDEF